VIDDAFGGINEVVK